MGSTEFQTRLSKRVMAGGSVFLAVWLLLEQHGFSLFTGKKESTVPCQEVVRSEAILSQKQLAQLLTIPEGDKKQRIQEIIKEPYCKLQSLQIRAGTTAQRDAYPLEFDQNTWLVILYEGEQYTGYRFAVR